MLTISEAEFNVGLKNDGELFVMEDKILKCVI